MEKINFEKAIELCPEAIDILLSDIKNYYCFNDDDAQYFVNRNNYFYLDDKLGVVIAAHNKHPLKRFIKGIGCFYYWNDDFLDTFYPEGFYEETPMDNYLKSRGW